MNLTDRFFSLGAMPPFDALPADELMKIADVARSRSFAPDASLGQEGSPMLRLHVVVAGCFRSPDGGRAPSILGLTGVLYDEPSPVTWKADPVEGASTLSIGRGHLFTILYACPRLTLGLLDRRAALPTVGPRP